MYKYNQLKTSLCTKTISFCSLYDIHKLFGLQFIARIYQKLYFVGKKYSNYILARVIYDSVHERHIILSSK